MLADRGGGGDWNVAAESSRLQSVAPVETVQALIDSLEAQHAAGAPAFEFKSIPQGAATWVWAAVVAPADEVGGRYCEDCHIAEPKDDGEMMSGGVRAYAVDPERAKALWALSERMVGETF